eukprot:g8701.t1
MLTCFSVLWQLNLQEYQEAGVDSAMLADQFYNMLDSFKVNDGFKTPPGKGFRMPWNKDKTNFLYKKAIEKNLTNPFSQKILPIVSGITKKGKATEDLIPTGVFSWVTEEMGTKPSTSISSSAGSSTSSLSRSSSTSSAASSPKNPSITQTFVGTPSNQTKVVASPTASRVQSPSSLVLCSNTASLVLCSNTASLVLCSNTAPVPMIIIGENDDTQEAPVVHDQAADTKSKQTSTDVKQEELEEPDEESDEEEGEPTEQQEEKHDKPEEQEEEQGEEQKPSAPLEEQEGEKGKEKKPRLKRKRSGKGVDPANKTTKKRMQTSNARARSLASRADERDNRDTIAVNIQQKTIESERKQGESLTELEKTYLRIRQNHEVGKFEIFYKRLFRASPAWQTRPLNSNQVKSLLGKIKENRFENLPPAYVYPVMLTAKGKQSIGLIDEDKFVQSFRNDPLNYAQFSPIQQFQEATAGLIPEHKVTENTQLAWPTDEVKRTYSNAKHQDVYYLVLGGNHGIAALKEALATDPKLAHPLLCFKSCLVYVNLTKLDAHAVGSISQKAAMHHWKEDDFATVLKLRSELLDLVPKDEAPDDRDVYLSQHVERRKALEHHSHRQSSYSRLAW